MSRSALKLEISRQSCRLSDMKTRKVFFRKKRQEFFLSFFDVVGNYSGNKTDFRIEYAGDEEERHIIYSSFLQLHKEEYCCMLEQLKSITTRHFPIDSQRGFYFPPSASKDRAVNSMEIKDFMILWTYSQWRQALVVIPPFSPEREIS